MALTSLSLESLRVPFPCISASESSAILLTSIGVGAVAVIEVQLRNPVIAGKVFSAFSAASERSLTDLPIGRIVYGQWGGEDVVVLRTCRKAWEIHCHGGPVAVERIFSDLQRSGVWIVRTEPGEAPTEDTDDVYHRLKRLLIKCRTPKTAGLILAHMDGRVDQLVQQSQSLDSKERNLAFDNIQKWQKVADHLTQPWRVGIVGPPNAGKSSLINSLAGLQRSIVSSTPGTTRDLIDVEIVVDGWLFQLVDSAGIRDVADSILEGIGIEQSLGMLAECDLACVVIDATNCHLTETFRTQLQTLTVPVCMLLNKSDLIDEHAAAKALANLHSAFSNEFPIDSVFSVSAQTQVGLSGFLSWMVRALIPEEPTLQTTLPLFQSSIVSPGAK